jgi:hypothetical protein
VSLPIHYIGEDGSFICEGYEQVKEGNRKMPRNFSMTYTY